MVSRLFNVIAVLMLLLPTVAMADVPANGGPRALTDVDRLFLARQFLEKIKPKLESAAQGDKEKLAATDLSGLPEGEELFFRIRLTNTIGPDYQLLAVNENKHLMLSLQDFINAVEFPIKFDPQTGNAEGWYIRENKRFDMNVKTRTVTTDQGTFKMSDAVREQDGDVVVPSDELARWFGFQLNPNIPQLEFRLVSDTKLPIQEKIERRDRLFGDATGLEPPRLPLKEDEQKLIDYPFVDVSSETRHLRPGAGGKATTTAFSNVRTSGDFLHGTLLTQSQFSKDDRLTSVRATYKKESLEPELLGPLKARRYEIGDISPVQVPISERYTSGVGVRVTNKDSLRTVTSAYTDVTGYSIPGWDVELYRQDQLLGFQTVGDDGQYRFPKVDLYGSDNTFRVVFYGTQGEVREEQIYIPVDPKRLADAGNAYDFSIVGQDTTSYNKFKIEDKDDGAPSVTALYEIPVGDASAITTGLLTRQNNGDQKATGIVGLSTTFAETLWNFDTAIDNYGEMAGEMIARKDIGRHQIRNETRVATDKFDYEEPDEQDDFNAIFTGQGPTDREVFGNEFNINGPLDLKLGSKPHYNGTLNYGRSAEGLNNLTGVVGFSTSMRPLSLNQQLVYEKNDAEPDDKISSLTNLTGLFDGNRVRLSSDYQIKPKSELQRVAASVNRNLTNTMEIEGGIQHFMDPKLTEVSAKLNWDTGYGNVSPGISYNTDKDVIATLSTRFGLARDPHSGNPKLFDRQITTNGGVSAFVFLDKNGDNIFNEDDEPIQDAIIKAPQNGGREITDEKGEAFFTRMGQLQLTDVYVDPNSLEDPYWIPAYEGASVLPREGHIISMDFPVHMSGEVDGTVYARGEGDTTYALKGISVGLYDKTGKKIQGVTSEQDGYYILSKIPPGSYYLVVDDSDLTKDASRPLPQPVTVGFEGTTIYANNIYLQQGTVDVPLSVLAGGLPYDADKMKPYEGRNFALNLGEYKSRMAMALAWFKVRALSGFALNGTDLIEKPSESIPRVGQTKYVLRLSMQENSLEEAYRKCGEIAHRGNYCSVEILPGGLGPEMTASKAE